MFARGASKAVHHVTVITLLSDVEFCGINIPKNFTVKRTFVF